MTVSTNRASRAGSVPQRLTQYFFLDAIEEGRNLVHRFQEGEAFRRHVRKRVGLILPLALLIAACSIACAAGTVVFFAGAGYQVGSGIGDGTRVLGALNGTAAGLILGTGVGYVLGGVLGRTTATSAERARTRLHET